ncbi:glycoside hydrolase N-terminal domain-containing protein [Verrucomicrobiota bacterium]
MSEEQATANVIGTVPDEVLPEELCRFRVDAESHLAAHDMVWGAPHGPPAHWVQGAPIGNGDLGAMVYGYPDNLTLALGKSDVWVRLDRGRSNWPAGTFADCRKAYLDGDRDRFETLRAGNGREPYDYWTGASHFTGAGTFRLHVGDASVLKACTQRLSLYRATLSQEFVPAGQTMAADACHGEPSWLYAMASRSHDVLVLRVEPGDYPLGHVLWELGRVEHPGYGLAEPGCDGDVGWFVQELAGGDRYAVLVAVEGAASGWTAAGSRAVGEWHGNTEQAPLTIYLTIVSSGDAGDLLGEGRRRLAAARAAGYEAVKAAHEQWWREFWQRSCVVFDRRDVEKGWYVSNYLCGSILQAGRQSPGLQGVWGKENFPGWNGDYHGNVNIQALYWGLYASNRLELAEPLLRYYTDILPQCRRDTESYFGMRGARLPHASDPFGYELTQPRSLPLQVSITPSGWIAKLFWDYYRYTGDRDFLERTGYPLIRDVAIFYEDYLVREPDGRYSVVPSVFFEVGQGFDMWGRNSTYDLATVRATFGFAVEAARVLARDVEHQRSWEEKLEHLASLPTDGEGIWRHWEGRDRLPNSWHVECFPVFPMELASRYHGPDELRQQAEATWRHLAELDMRPRAWCGGWGVALAVRMGDADWALKQAAWPAKGNPTGAIGGWDHRVIQWDHGPGMSRALSDILLLSAGGVVHLFPAVPEDVTARFHSLRVPGAFLVSAEKRGADVTYALVQSLQGGQFRFANPFGDTVTARVRDITSGVVIREGPWDNGGTVAVDTEQGHVYVIERSDLPLERIEVESIPSAVNA